MNTIITVYPFCLSFQDYPTPEDWSIVVYFTGCGFYCPNCHNKDLQIFNNPQLKTKEFTLNSFIYELKQASIIFETNKIVFSGGDPLFIRNLQSVKKILSKIKDIFDVCVYTGYNIEDIIKMDITGFKYIKCGKLVEPIRTSIKTDKYFQLASANQDFYDSEYKKLSTDGILQFS